jgi:hypothetical protein
MLGVAYARYVEMIDPGPEVPYFSLVSVSFSQGDLLPPEFQVVDACRLLFHSVFLTIPVDLRAVA